MIEEKIYTMLKNKKWKFGEITQIENLIRHFREAIYNDLTAKEKLDLIWDNDIGGETFANYFKRQVDGSLDEHIAKVIQVKLQTANVYFNEDDNNEISKISLGGEPHKERSSNETKHSEE